VRKTRCGVLVLFVLLIPKILDADLKKVISIGSNDLNYLFFSIAGAILDENQNIYVLDSKGFFLRKYDAQGKFVKEIGQQGQGPGDFSNVLSGFCLDNDLYILDGANSRIMETDRDLNIKKTIKVEHPGRCLVKIGDLFYMISSKGGEPFPEIVICDNKGKSITSFFDQRPEFISGPMSSKMEFALRKIYSDITMTGCPDREEIAVAFKFPDRKVGLFIYSKQGQPVKKIVLDNLVRYRFPAFRLHPPVNYPGQSDLIMLGSLHYLGGNKLLLEYWQERYESEKAVDHKLFLLVIDMTTAEIISREPVSATMNIMDAKGNLICAREEEGDAPKVVLYRLDY